MPLIGDHGITDHAGVVRLDHGLEFIFVGQRPHLFGQVNELDLVAGLLQHGAHMGQAVIKPQLGTGIGINKQDFHAFFLASLIRAIISALSNSRSLLKLSTWTILPMDFPWACHLLTKRGLLEPAKTVQEGTPAAAAIC